MKISELRLRIDQLLALSAHDATLDLQNQLYHGTLTILQTIYGSNSAQEIALNTSLENVGGVIGNPGYRQQRSCLAIKGVLLGIKADIDSGLPASLRASASGEVLTDLVRLVKTVLEENGDDAKNVGAVLAAAAFEDTIRKIGDINNIPHTEKLADVLTELKDRKVLQGSQVGIAQSYLGFRNDALHAQWHKIERPGVHSALGFV
jgi:hypothetical protein